MYVSYTMALHKLAKKFNPLKWHIQRKETSLNGAIDPFIP